MDLRILFIITYQPVDTNSFFYLNPNFLFPIIVQKGMLIVENKRNTALLIIDMINDFEFTNGDQLFSFAKEAAHTIKA